MRPGRPRMGLNVMPIESAPETTRELVPDSAASVGFQRHLMGETGTREVLLSA